MKNITLSIDEGLLARARKLAAERGTSVNKMVRELLARETGTESRRQRQARERLVELARNSDWAAAPGWRWNREDIYAERLSRYQHTGVRGERETR